ncbi:FecR domain-containing protein [Microbacteriaceae bacterium K1510]|nr:FecR domain-containing protein [Microbacteriaceae bacterium K1510]
METEHGSMTSGLEREALARVRRLISGEATLEDIEDTTRWRALSPAHAEAFAFASRLWDQLGPAGRNVAARRPDTVPLRQPVMRNRRAIILGGAAAAASVAFVVVRPPLDLWPSLAELSADYRTAPGEQRRVVLPNGAAVELNTRTSISLQFAADHERLELITGEATIATGATTSKPLVVVAGDGRADAQNARFNVRYDGLAAQVTCLEGVVQVARDDTSLMLEARHQIAYANRGLTAPVVIDPAAVTAWREGVLVFHAAPLSDVVAEVNRYRPGKIVLMNADLARKTVNARFRIDNIDEIMTLAQRVFGAKVTSLPGGIVVLG